MKEFNVKFKKLISTAKTPTKSYDTDSGFDFYCTKIEKEPNRIIYHTGIALEMDAGIGGFVFPRSSVVKKDLMLKNSVGVIDNSYRGEIIAIFNDTKAYSAVQNKEVYEEGDRVAQVVFLELPKINLIEVDELSETDRNTGGFGSTGK